MFVRYPPGKIRYQGDRPAALLGVRVAPSFRLVDLPLGRLATRDRQGDLDRQAAKAYWLSGPDTHRQHASATAPERSGKRPRIDRGTGGPQARGGRVPRRNGGPPWR